MQIYVERKVSAGKTDEHFSAKVVDGFARVLGQGHDRMATVAIDAAARDARAAGHVVPEWLVEDADRQWRGQIIEIAKSNPLEEAAPSCGCGSTTAGAVLHHHEETTVIAAVETNTSTPPQAPPFDAGLSFLHGQACLPWVQLVRHPGNYEDCTKLSRAIGPIKSAKRVFEILKEDHARFDQEIFVGIFLDIHCYTRGASILAKGARDIVLVPIVDTVDLSISLHAKSVIVTHHHPSGEAKPSKGDRKATKDLERALKSASGGEITLMDSIIFGAPGTNPPYFSFAEHNLLKE